MDGPFFIKVEEHYCVCVGGGGVLLHLHLQFPPFPLCSLTPLSSYKLWHSSQCALTPLTIPDPFAMHLAIYHTIVGALYTQVI
jgi:hypothetical protein